MYSALGRLKILSMVSLNISSASAANTDHAQLELQRCFVCGVETRVRVHFEQPAVEGGVEDDVDAEDLEAVLASVPVDASLCALEHCRDDRADLLVDRGRVCGELGFFADVLLGEARLPRET